VGHQLTPVKKRRNRVRRLAMFSQVIGKLRLNVLAFGQGGMERFGASAVAHNWCGHVAVRLRFTGHALAHAVCPASVQTLDVNRA
jgi:hypothetical protein